MHNYDLNVILSPNLSETQLGLEKDAITAQIGRVEGQVNELDEWGNKRLAYPIRKLNEGYYLIYKLSLSESAPRQLATNLRLRDNVMRVLITRDRPEQRTRKEAPPRGENRNDRSESRGDRNDRNSDRSESRTERTEAQATPATSA